MARKPDTLPPRYNGKHPGGRPTKRTPDRVRRLAKAIADGLPDEYACALVGITRETLQQWRSDPDFKEFSATIKTVQAKRLLKRLAVIEAGGPGWQSTAWILERCYAKEFCRPEIQFNQAIALSSNNDSPTYRALTREELLECIETSRRIELERPKGCQPALPETPSQEAG
jgi:hypothetical protein